MIPPNFLKRIGAPPDILKDKSQAPRLLTLPLNIIDGKFRVALNDNMEKILPLRPTDSFL